MSGSFQRNFTFTRLSRNSRTFIQHGNFVFQRDKAVRKADRDEKVVCAVQLKLRRKRPCTFRRLGRAAPYVDGDIKNSAMQYADQLGLRCRRFLKMKPAQRALLARCRLIVLDEAAADAEVTQPLLMKALAEPAARVGTAHGYDGKG